MIAITSNVQVERPLPLAPSGSTASAGSVVPSSLSAASASAAGSVHSSASTADSVSLSERAEAQLLHQQGQGPSDIASRLDVDVSHVKDDLRITVDGVSLVPSPTRLAATGASPAVTPPVVQPSAPPSTKASAPTDNPLGATAASSLVGKSKDPNSTAPAESSRQNSASGHITQTPEAKQTSATQNGASPSSPIQPQSNTAANSTVAALTAGLAPPRIEGLIVPVIPPRG